MDSKWFKEDRALPKQEQREAMKGSKEALKNSTIMSRRLIQILDEMIDACYRDDEDFTKHAWQLEAIANASRRKTLKEVKQLVTFK